MKTVLPLVSLVCKGENTIAVGSKVKGGITHKTFKGKPSRDIIEASLRSLWNFTANPFFQDWRASAF